MKEKPFEFKRMYELIKEGWIAYYQGNYNEAVSVFNEVWDSIPINSTGSEKKLLEEALRGLYQFRFSTDEGINYYPWLLRHTDVLFQYREWYQKEIQEEIRKVIKGISSNSYFPPQDYLKVKKLFDLKLFKVLVIGPSEKNSLIKEALEHNKSLWLIIIDIDHNEYWHKSLEDFVNKGNFNAIVITDDSPFNEIMSYIERSEHQEGVPVLVYGAFWPTFVNTDKLMYCFNYICALKSVIEWYCMASMVSKYMEIPFEPENTTVLVRDKPGNCLLANAILKRDGYIAETTSNMDETIKRIAETEPYVVFTDLMPPDRYTYELLDRIRSEKRYKYLPIVLLSAVSGIPDWDVRAYEKGYTVTMGKPMSISIFEGVVKQMAMLNKYLRIYSMIDDTE